MGAERRLGDYTLVRELGRGGMGVVWAAQHPRFGSVALKVALDGVHGDPDGLARLRREATALQRLSHPNVVGVHEVGEHGGRPFVAMAFVDGESLHERLRRGPLEAADAARITLGIASALTYVHAQGVLHRDLKPRNVLLRRDDGEPVLVDFGLARLSREQQRLTTTGQAVGTPAYMAPEQALGLSRPTSALDVYGLGATFYEMLCGVPPFTGSSDVAVLTRVLEEPPAPPAQVDPRVDRELEQLCLACLEKDPARRPEAADLAAALARWRDAHVGRPRRGRPSTRGVPVLIGAALAVTTLGLAFAASRDGPPAAAPPPTPSEVAALPTAIVALAAPPVADPAKRDDEALELLRRAVPLVTKGRPSAIEALDLARRAAGLSPRAPRVLFASAWVARSAARAGVEEPPWALLAQAQELLAAAEATGSASDAVGRLRDMIEADRRDLERLHALRDARDLAGQFEAVKLARQLERREQAIELLLAVREEHGPTRPDVYMRCSFNLAGELFTMAGRGDDALAAYAHVLETARASHGDPGFATRYTLWCHLRMAELNVELARDAEALDHADAALRLPRAIGGERVFGAIDVGKLEMLRARALAHQRQWDGALEAADRVIDEFTAHGQQDALATPLALRGAALVGLGRAQEGRDCLMAALGRAHDLPLQGYGTKLAVSELARQALPDDREIDTLVQAAFP